MQPEEQNNNNKRELCQEESSPEKRHVWEELQITLAKRLRRLERDPFVQFEETIVQPINRYSIWNQKVNREMGASLSGTCCKKMHGHGIMAYDIETHLNHELLHFEKEEEGKEKVEEVKKKRNVYIRYVGCPVFNCTSNAFRFPNFGKNYWFGTEIPNDPQTPLEYFSPTRDVNGRTVEWGHRQCLHFPNHIFHPLFIEAHRSISNLDELQKTFDTWDKDPCLTKLVQVLFCCDDDDTPLISPIIRKTPILLLWILNNQSDKFKQSRLERATHLISGPDHSINVHDRKLEKLMSPKGMVKMTRIETKRMYITHLIHAADKMPRSVATLFFDQLLQNDMLDLTFLGGLELMESDDDLAYVMSGFGDGFSGAVYETFKEVMELFLNNHLEAVIKLDKCQEFMNQK